jgi:hypothetical protein
MSLGESWNCQHCGAPNGWVHAYCGSCDLPFRTVEREVEEVEPMQIRLDLPLDLKADVDVGRYPMNDPADHPEAPDFDDESEED